jgi:NAD(P)-dependent dehydrogenase (short-subunit alcohol dehydrogenase family)
VKLQGELGVVIVTGGASGLGAAVAAEVGANGGTAVVFDIDAPSVDADFKKVDVSDRASVQAAMDEVVQEHGTVNAVVTAAGVDACGKLSDVDADRWEKVIGVNLLGTVNVVRAALPNLESTHGKVVTVASTLGMRALSDATAYCASKFGVVGFTRALSAEMAGRVGVTLLIPGGMQTAFFDDRDPQYKPGPDTQLNDPQDVARSVVFALSQPAGCEVKELLITNSAETSWP